MSEKQIPSKGKEMLRSPRRRRIAVTSLGAAAAVTVLVMGTHSAVEADNAPNANSGTSIASAESQDVYREAALAEATKINQQLHDSTLDYTDEVSRYKGIVTVPDPDGNGTRSYDHPIILASPVAGKGIDPADIGNGLQLGVLPSDKTDYSYVVLSVDGATQFTPEPDVAPTESIDNVRLFFAQDPETEEFGIIPVASGDGFVVNQAAGQEIVQPDPSQ